MTPVFTIWSDAELHPAAVAALDGRARLIRSGSRYGSGDSVAGMEQADGVLAGGGFALTDETVRRAGRLTVVARLGTGIDNIDLDAASRHGICVTHTPDAPTVSTAEFAVGLMLCVARRMKIADRALSTGRPLAPWEATGFDLSERTLGLVGLGRIGSRVAQLARAFGMSVIAHDPGVSPDWAAELDVELTDELMTLLRRTDVLSIHVPLNAGTRGLIGKRELASLRPRAIVVNVSRGPIVDAAALVDALDAGHLAGAGIDVWDFEPPEPPTPLLRRDNVVATPHIAAMTDEGRARSNVTAVEQVLSVFDGVRPTGLVNSQVWPHRRRLAEDRTDE